MIIAIIILLFASFFFSGSETALRAVNKMKLQTKVNDGDQKAQKILDLVSKSKECITAVIIGKNVANISLAAFITILAINYDWNVGIAVALLILAIIVFAEILPKAITATYPDSIVYVVYPVFRLVVIILKPIILLLIAFVNTIKKLLSRGKEVDASLSKEDLRAMIELADLEGTFAEDESDRIRGVLDFYHLNVKDVLNTPRIDILALPNTATYEEVRDIVMQSPFTRYPVYDEDIDNIIGIFHSKYLIQWSMQPEKSLESFCDMEPLIVYEFHSIEWVFRKIMKEKKHMAIVLDEYGGTEGIITHEDIIEAMIGLEIEDEMDSEEDALVESLTETEIVCDGKITLHRLNLIFDTKIPEDEDVLSGYLLKEFKDFPEEGAIIERNNLTFKVLEVEGRTINKVQIVK